MKRAIISMVLLLALAALVVPAACAAPVPVGNVSPEIERAVLAEDWKRVVGLCGPSEKLARSPILRAIKGHALLATNHNNDALLLLMSLQEAGDLPAWQQWTAELSARHPRSPVAWYLLGDAYARLERWEEAVRAFDQALRLKPSFALALNARGVARAGQGRWEEAFEDLERVSAMAPEFADAHANLGTYWLYNRGPNDAMASFSRARQASPNFALAMNGSGCARFQLGYNYLRAAGGEFASAARQVGLPLFLQNLDSVEQAAVEISSKSNLYLVPEDFVDWAALRKELLDPSSPFHPHFSRISLQERPTRPAVDAFNAILEDRQFYDRNRQAIEATLGTQAGRPRRCRLPELVRKTEPFRRKAPEELNAFERARVRGLNRCVLEELYPTMIREAGRTKAGMSLTTHAGIAVDGYSYKQRLSTRQLWAGKHRMENLYRPLADFVEKIPIAGSVGQHWNRHLDSSLAQTDEILKSRGANPLSSGGVSMEEMQASFFQAADWSVVNWFGLAYHVVPPKR